MIFSTYEVIGIALVVYILTCMMWQRKHNNEIRQIYKQSVYRLLKLDDNLDPELKKQIEGGAAYKGAIECLDEANLRKEPEQGLDAYLGALTLASHVAQFHTVRSETILRKIRDRICDEILTNVQHSEAFRIMKEEEENYTYPIRRGH